MLANVYSHWSTKRRAYYEHRTAASISFADVNVFVNAVLALVEPVKDFTCGARNCATRLMNWSWKPLSMVALTRS